MIDPAQVEAAQAYEKLFIPALFGQWPEKLFDHVPLASSDKVLDVACGTGILTRKASKHIPEKQLTGLDLNAGMLAVAKQHAPEINWVSGNAENLPFDDNQFDCVFSQFGLMFFPDPGRALGEMARVLTPDGNLGVVVWAGTDTMPAYHEEIVMLDLLAGADAANALRAPFHLGDKSTLSQLCKHLDLSNLKLTTLQGQAVFPSIRSLIEADLRGWLPIMNVHLDEALIQEILKEAESRFSNYRNNKGEMVFDVFAHLITATKP